MSAREEILLEADDPRVMTFVHALAGTNAKVDAPTYWRAYSRAFPHRSPETERQLLRAVLEQAERRGLLRLPSPRGGLWDRAVSPALPRVVFRVRAQTPARSDSWRRFPWHPALQWVLALPALTAEQEALLRRVHAGLVADGFREPAPLRYRSLQLTGDEKTLLRMARSKTLFGPGRLTKELLGCMREPTPFAWVHLGASPRAIALENVGPFHAASEALRRIREPPFGVVIYGAGGAFRRSVRYARALPHALTEIVYVGDLDLDGVRIARDAAEVAAARALPRIVPYTAAHCAMLAAAARFGAPDGWPHRRRRTPGDADALLFLAEDVRAQLAAMIEAAHRVPEEVLGPADWAALFAAEQATPQQPTALTP